MNIFLSDRLAREASSHLMNILSPDQLRLEDRRSRADAVLRSTRHRLAVNTMLSLDHRVGPVVHHPLPVRALDQQRIVLVSGRSIDPAGSAWPGDERLLTDIVPAESCLTCRRNVGFWTPPELDRCRRVTSCSVKHIAEDHSERLGGLSAGQGRARIRAAVRELSAALPTMRSDLVGTYWYPGTRAWCFVAPLHLDLGGWPLAGVLVPTATGYHLQSVLEHRRAFWNIAGLGITPPRWLDGPDDRPDTATAA